MNKTRSKKILSTTVFAAITVLLAFSAITIPASANDKEDAIDNGLEWLADQQDPATGAWNLGDWPVGSTAFAVLKFEHHAKYILDIDPFDDDYIYKDNIVNGLNYLFNHSYYIDIDNQTVPAPRNDDPEEGQASPNGKGIYFVSDTPDRRSLYETGIMMMALEASCNKTRKVQYGEHAGLTYLAVMQDMVDYISWAQQDSGWGRGGWRYCAWDDGVAVPNTGITHPGADNSVSQWPVLGLMSAAGWGIDAPDWVKRELEDHWLVHSQSFPKPSGDGCFGYSSSAGGSVAMTAAGLIELTYCGVTTDDPRWEAGRQCICENWGNSNIGNLYAMYGVMKAAMTANWSTELEPIWWYNCTKGTHEWQPEYDAWLIDNQDDDGYWTAYYGSNTAARRVLGTEWALLILQKVVPPPRLIPVYVDIKPGSCPNPLNKGSKGVLPVAVLGTEDFDVTAIDPETILLSREDVEGGVAPIRWSYEDIATPFTGELCDCHELEGDGILDLTLKFSTQTLVDKLDLCPFDGQTIPLTITGNLKEEEGGTPIEGEDCIWVLKPGKK